MNKSLLFLITIGIGLTLAAEEKVRSLCDDPLIFTADRLPNNTVRVYRGNYYWELTGLPDRVAKVTGPFKIKNQYMGPTQINTSIMTVLSGPMKGNTWKFQGGRVWQWDPSGSLVIGGKGGVTWEKMPKGGFSCAFNDGDYDKKGSTRMIALKGLYAYYWKTDTTIFTEVGDIYKGYLNGQFGEQFPADPTACMSFNMDTAEAKYYVYIFKRKEYCFRPITGEKGCKEWRKNTELFGCQNQGSGEDSSPPESNGSGSDGGDSGSDGGDSGSGASNPIDSSKPKPKPKPPKHVESQAGNEANTKPSAKSGVSVRSMFQNSLLLLVLFSFFILQ